LSLLFDLEHSWNRRSKRLEGSTAKSKSIPCRPIQTPETCPAFSCPSFSAPPFIAIRPWRQQTPKHYRPYDYVSCSFVYRRLFLASTAMIVIVAIRIFLDSSIASGRPVVSVSGFFAPLPFRPLDDSPPGSFAPWLIRPRTLDDSPWVYCDAMSTNKL